MINIFYIVVCLIVIFTATVFYGPQQTMGQKEFPSSISNTTTTSDFLTYENPLVGIKMQYPSNWTVSSSALRDYTDVVAFYSPLQNLSDALPAQLVLSMVRYSQNISLDEYTNLSLSALNQSQQFIVNESNPFTLANNPAHKIIFSAISPTDQGNFNVMQIWTSIGNKLYILSYNAEASKFSKNLPTIEQMLQSVEIK
ncbi:MAG: serine/threonine protein kinase [Nitrososphaeraceae archaeon]|nr:serine/threonine protein kinase [Nitrososphaeraceae archaeon]MCD6036832.1 serine/threonine protein kinase [Nitrososphaeraceae archaeon]MDF2767761.1 serine/threonine protein kinase [Nitrososphaeraceae archaeon]